VYQAEPAQTPRQPPPQPCKWSLLFALGLNPAQHTPQQPVARTVPSPTRSPPNAWP